MKVISIPTRILALPQSTEIDEANQPLFLEETYPGASTAAKGSRSQPVSAENMCF